MEIDQVETFLAVATYGGFHRAAEAIRVSQPAVSARIRALEDSLGVTLFTRGHNALSLSPAGKALRPLAEQLLRTIEIVLHARIGADMAARTLAEWNRWRVAYRFGSRPRNHAAVLVLRHGMGVSQTSLRVLRRKPRTIFACICCGKASAHSRRSLRLLSPFSAHDRPYEGWQRHPSGG